MDVSVIIVNYNTLELTKACIESVFEKTKNLSFEVILIDNGSIDRSKEYFEKEHRIKYLYNSENVGFGRANNIGLRIAKGRNILFLNSDTLLCNNAIHIMSSFLDTYSEVGACGGNLYDQNMLPSYSFGRLFPSILADLNFLLFYIPEKIRYGKGQNFNYSEKVIFVPHVSGADMMVKKSVLERIGTFNEAFFMYREETEMCLRIKKAGYKIASIPFAKIIHLEGKSCESNQILRKERWMYESRKIFFRLHHKYLYIQIANLIHRFGIYVRILLHLFFRKEYRSYWLTALKYL